MITTLANSLWLAGCSAELVRFRRAISHVEEEQRAVLSRILKRNADTQFGKEHAFFSIRTAAEFQSRVPVRDYNQLEPWINQAAAGVPHMLTQELVRLFEPTSGSSGASKLIPYTASLQREFQHAIRAWIGDLYSNVPSLLTGQAYWSVSPRVGAVKTTSGGTTIGFDDDASYVGGWQQKLVNAVMAVPAIRQTPGIEDFWYQTLLYLARARHLRLISVWNPTYLMLLLDRLDHLDLDRFCRDLANYGCSKEVRLALLAKSREERYARLWPKLKLISCWTDANAQGPASRLAALFPHCKMQGKGLIATEAFISLPLVGHEHAVLAIRSHFLEFLPNGSAVPLLAHQLEKGAQYTIVVTTGGGLYRYRLGDMIEVTGHLKGCPLIRFVGREGYVSDWFGEKLNDAHVARAFREVFRALGISPSFAMLACETQKRPGYALYIESPESEQQLARAAKQIDAELRTNFHYDYARELGQLGPVYAVPIEDGARAYLDVALRNGQRAGDVKATALDRRNIWTGIFKQDRRRDSVSHTSL